MLLVLLVTSGTTSECLKIYVIRIYVTKYEFCHLLPSITEEALTFALL